MSLPYNPFELLSHPLLKQWMRKGIYLVVIERFEWPGVVQNRGFMVTPYDQEQKAKIHAGLISSDKGRLLDLRKEYNLATGLINDPRFYFFVSAFREINWKPKLLAHYRKEIETYLATAPVLKLDDLIDIQFDLKCAQLRTTFYATDLQKEANFLDLIKLAL